MTGRHAAAPDELFDQRERDRAGAHRADVELPGSVPAAIRPAPAKKAAKATPEARAKPAPQKKASK